MNISSHRKHNTLLHFLEANEKTAPLFDLQNSDNLAEIRKGFQMPVSKQTVHLETLDRQVN